MNFENHWPSAQIKYVFFKKPLPQTDTLIPQLIQGFELSEMKAFVFVSVQNISIVQLFSANINVAINSVHIKEILRSFIDTLNNGFDKRHPFICFHW